MYTEEQIAALKYLISKSRNPDLKKQILVLLIDSSEGLSKGVCITLIDGREGYSGEEISDAAYVFDTCSINKVLRAMGSELVLSVHYGDFDPSREGRPFSSAGIFAGANPLLVGNPESVRENMPTRYTFWLAKDFWSSKAELVETTREVLEQIDLKKLGH